MYNQLREEWKKKQPKGEKEDIIDDIVFETELLKQIEINIDYILLLVARYHQSNCQDKEVLVTIRSAVDSSPELHSKKELIESFIARVNDLAPDADVVEDWHGFVADEREKELETIIAEEKLKPAETKSLSKIRSRRARSGPAAQSSKRSCRRCPASEAERRPRRNST